MNNESPKFEEKQIQYLQMIESAISRMSTSSAIFKGFSATIVAGISLISFKEIHVWILILSFLPIICFMALDIYYLNIEKKYRYLYEQVRSGSHPIDFNMSIKELNYVASGKKNLSVFSPSIYLFYIPLIAICLLVSIFKIIGMFES